MDDRLNTDYAVTLATRLELIDRFPRGSDILEAVAEWLIQICQGGFIEDRTWTPKEQADWLIKTAIENEMQWQGLARLRHMFLYKFVPPPDEPQHMAAPEQEERCPLCNDFGIVYENGVYSWCQCGEAKVLRSARPNYVDALNHPAQRRYFRSRRQNRPPDYIVPASERRLPDIQNSQPDQTMPPDTRQLIEKEIQKAVASKATPQVKQKGETDET